MGGLTNLVKITDRQRARPERGTGKSWKSNSRRYSTTLYSSHSLIRNNGDTKVRDLPVLRQKKRELKLLSLGGRDEVR